MGMVLRTTIVIPEEKLKSLKKLAFEQGSSLNRLINRAVDQVFFKAAKRKNFNQLRGIWKGIKITDKDLQEVQFKLKEAL